MSYEIGDDCIGCGGCAKRCPAGAIQGEIKEKFEIDPVLCEECGTCFENCPKAAIIDPYGKRHSVEKGKKRKRTKAVVDRGLCAGCQTCRMNCPQEAISYVKKGFLSSGYCQVDSKCCIGCGICTNFCITGAISRE